MSADRETIQTYDAQAIGLSKYFRGIGSRVFDVEMGLSLSPDIQAARVVEIGCGDGRDAAEIIPRVGFYEGIDPSEGMLDIARRNLPEASFVQADALSYDYPDDLDVVFAFASLLHVNREDFRRVTAKVEGALRPDGVFYLSLKERNTYAEERAEDKFGARQFYYYNPKIVQELVPSSFEAVYEDHQHLGQTDWFTLALQKT